MDKVIVKWTITAWKGSQTSLRLCKRNPYWRGKYTAS